jgi:hypothetical protein
MDNHYSYFGSTLGPWQASACSYEYDAQSPFWCPLGGRE